MRGNRNKLRGMAGKMLLLLISGALALVGAELAVRVLAPQQLIVLRPDVWKADAGLGQVKRPNVNTTLNVGAGPVRFVTDDRGFRVADKARPEGAYRILLLGDSFMEAREVNYEESLAGLLEAELSTRLGAPVEVWNTAVSGWGPSHYLIQARRVLQTETVDLIVVAVYLGNDIVNRRIDSFPPAPPTITHRLRPPERASWTEFVDAVLYPINDQLERRSHLFVLSKKLVQPLVLRANPQSLFPVGVQREMASAPLWDLTTGLFEDVADLGAARGIPTLFVLIPSVQQVDPEIADMFLRLYGLDRDEVDFSQPGRIVSRRLADAGLWVVDASERFGSLQANGHDLYEPIGWHLAAAGHRALTDLLSPSVQAHLSEPSVARDLPPATKNDGSGPVKRSQTE